MKINIQSNTLKIAIKVMAHARKKKKLCALARKKVEYVS